MEKMKVGFTTSLSLVLMFEFLGTQGVNLELILFLKVVLVLSTYRPSQCEL